MYFFLSYMFFLPQNRGTRRWNRFFPEAGGRGWMAQIMCTHVSKCKNKIKLKLN
jgi:hypothetical protein